MTYKASKSRALRLWKTLGGHRAGRWLVSRIVCFVAPYFRSIRPVFTVMEPGHVEVHFRKRRAVQNHLGSVHAIAMCNAAELAGGTCMDISLHADFRWIPVGMEVKYLKIARTDLTAVCRIENYRWEEPRDVVMPVRVVDTDGAEVLTAAITMRISRRRND